jgi:hypothetical protein
MTQPRQVLAGTTSLVTRRTLRRHHLFRPDPAIRDLYLYVLAIAARDSGILVHALTLMSTHEHLVVTDPRGCMPDFLRRLHRLVALGTKSVRNWDGPVWDGRRTSTVRLATEAAIVEKLAYVIANPAEAGLVELAREWPGIVFLPQELGRRTLRLRRPAGFFSGRNPSWPEEVELELTMPPALDRAYAHDAIRDAVAGRVQQIEQAARDERARLGRRVLGPERIRRLSPFARTTTAEPRGGLNPTFAVGRGQSRAFREALAEVREFRRAYRQAFEQWREGLRTVVFPEGTWLMKRLHGASV